MIQSKIRQLYVILRCPKPNKRTIPASAFLFPVFHAFPLRLPEQLAELFPEVFHIPVYIPGVQIDFTIHKCYFQAGFTAFKSSQSNALPAGNELVRGAVHRKYPRGQEEKRQQRCRNISLNQKSPVPESLYSVQRRPPDLIY